MTSFDLTYPTSQEGGEFARTADGQLRWRQMGRLFGPGGQTGVCKGKGDGFAFHGWWGNEPGQVVLGPGAVWAMGAYGERGLDDGGWFGVLTPGDDGWVVARMGPGRQAVWVYYKGRASGGPEQNPQGGWEVPLWELSGFGNVTDRRPWVPEDPAPPPLLEVPSWVPKPYHYEFTGTGQPVVGVGGPQRVAIWYLDWDPAWVPGRGYRVTMAWRGGPMQRQGNNYQAFAWSICEVFMGDNTGEKVRMRPWRLVLDNVRPPHPKTITFAHTPLGASAYVGVDAWIEYNGQGPADLYNLPWLTVNVADVGGT